MWANGMIGVDIFFIISGFIIYHATKKKSESEPKVFITKRLFRIYPVFFTLWFVTALINFGEKPFSEVIRGLFFLHVNYSNAAPSFGFNIIGPAWTLTYEIFFYAIFCLMAFISHKHRGLLTIIALLTIPLALQWHYNSTISFKVNVTANIDTNSILTPIVRVLGSTLLYEFALGIFIAFLFDKIKIKISNLTCISFFAIGMICFSYLFITITNHTSGVTGLLPVALLCFISFLALDFGTLKESKYLSYIGNISYALYLSHWCVIRTYLTFFPKDWNNVDWVIKFVPLLASSFLLAILLHKFIEKPCIKFARSLLSRGGISDNKPIILSTMKPPIISANDEGKKAMPL